MIAVALAPDLWVALGALVVAGAAATSFLAFSNSVLQLNSRPEMRGRVLALRAVAFLGTRPVGAPVIGWMGEYLGPRYAVGMGALAALAAAGFGYRALGRLSSATDRRPNEQPTRATDEARDG